MLLLETKDLSLGYDNKEILKDINIHIDSGDYVCIIGNNGSGKSTLIRGLLGLLSPMQGKVALSSSLSQKQIGYLPQITTSQQNFPASVYEIVSSGLLNSKRLSPFFNKEEKNRITKALQQLHIEDLCRKSYMELSGGQQQKVLIARSLCATHQLLILDEPITGLDSSSRQEVYEMIYRLHKEENIAIVMITHHLDEVLDYATQVITVEENIVTQAPNTHGGKKHAY